MRYFLYTIQDQNGRLQKGRIRADDHTRARQFLRERKLTIVSLKEDMSSRWREFVFGKPKVRPEDIVLFSQLFSGTIQAGLTIKESLKLLSKQMENGTLEERIEEILLDIESGFPLSGCFSKHTDIFPEFYPMLLKAGEVSGDLVNVLEYIATYLERINGIKKEIIAVITYPAIVLTMTAVLLTFILTFVAPTFISVFTKAKIKLPVPTKIMFAMSDAFRLNYPYIILAILCIAGIIYYIRKNPVTRKKLDRWILSAPIAGKVISYAMLLRFIKAFDILINNQVPILQALQVLEDSTSNLALKDLVREMRKEVSRGMAMSGPLIDAREIVPPIMAYSISMGEKAGKLGASLSRLSGYVDKEMSLVMKKLSGRLDPIMTFILGAIVLFVALSIYLPIFDMISTVGTS